MRRRLLSIRAVWSLALAQSSHSRMDSSRTKFYTEGLIWLHPWIVFQESILQVSQHCQGLSRTIPSLPQGSHIYLVPFNIVPLWPGPWHILVRKPCKPLRLCSPQITLDNPAMNRWCKCPRHSSGYGIVTICCHIHTFNFNKPMCHIYSHIQKHGLERLWRERKMVLASAQNKIS